MFSFRIASLSLAISVCHIRWEIQDVLKRDILTNIPPCSWILKFYDILVVWQILRNHTSIDPSISYESEPNRLTSDPCIRVTSLHHRCWCNNQGRKFVFVSSLHPFCFKPQAPLEWLFPNHLFLLVSGKRMDKLAKKPTGGLRLKTKRKWLLAPHEWLDVHQNLRCPEYCTSWWFQPIWITLVKLNHFPR